MSLIYINPYSFQALWTPANITTALWFDATDSSTITLTSGAVSQWNDKSGNSRNATQATSTRRPGYNATGLNSKGIITFDGGDVMDTSDFYTSDWCMVAVAQHTNAATAGTIASKFNGVGNNREWLFRTTTANELQGVKYDDGSTGQFIETTANAGTSFGVFGFYKNDTAARLSINGTSETFTFPNNLVHNGTEVVRLGATDSGAAFQQLDGAIQQFVMVAGAQTVDTFEKLEGWAAWSSGLQGNLPAGHPYEFAAPTQ